MNIKHKKVLLYGTERLKRDFIYLFPKIKIDGYILDNCNEIDNIYDFNTIDKTKLKRRIIVICDRKNINIIEKMYCKGLKEKKNYIFFEDLGYLINDKIDKLAHKLLKFYFSNIKHRSFKNYIPNSFYLKKMIYTDSREGFNCDYPFKYMQIQSNTFVYPCCEGWTNKEIGSILLKRLNSIWNSSLARLYRLSIINKTYIFCNPNSCPFLKKEFNHTNIRNEQNTLEYPNKVCVAIDISCNLKCPSCRKRCHNINKGPKYIGLKYLSSKIIHSKISLRTNELIMASQGEVFFSKIYRKMLFESKLTKRDSITIHTNGTLFTKKNLDRLHSIYKDIKVFISVDAVKKETYEKIRVGGNFDILMKNLENISAARKKGIIKYVELLFVVQQSNYKEMPKFIEKTKKLGFDKVNFSKIDNWDTFTEEEFKSISVFDENNNPKNSLLRVLENPLFDDKIVDKESNIMKIREKTKTQQNKC